MTFLQFCCDRGAEDRLLYRAVKAHNLEAACVGHALGYAAVVEFVPALQVLFLAEWDRWEDYEERRKAVRKREREVWAEMERLDRELREMGCVGALLHNDRPARGGLW